MNEIILNFNKSITTLVGSRFGHNVYKKQIKSRIKENEKNIVVFPVSIKDISTSFIEGMYKELRTKYQALDALKIMELHACNSETENKIKDIFETYEI